MGSKKITNKCTRRFWVFLYRIFDFSFVFHFNLPGFEPESLEKINEILNKTTTKKNSFVEKNNNNPMLTTPLNSVDLGLKLLKEKIKKIPAPDSNESSRLGVN